MRRFLFSILAVLLFFSLYFFILPNSKPVFALACGDFVVSRDSRCREIRNTSGTLGTCNYTEVTYQCVSGIEEVTCIQKSPLDCGNGVTVCGGPTVNDGYNCVTWCSDVYSGYTRPCEILRDTNTVTSDDNFGVYDSTLGRYTNKRNDNCYWGSRCINPTAGGASCTQGSANCSCDTRLACTDYVSQCITNTRSNCETNECNNAGTLPSNACPGSGQGVQCDPNHSCVFQVPVTQVVQPPVTSCYVDGAPGVIQVDSGSFVIFSWSATNNPTSCTGSDALPSERTWPGTGSWTTPILTNTTTSPLTRTYSIQCSNAGGTSGLCSASVIIQPVGCSTTNCGACGSCNNCISKNSCGWNGDTNRCIRGTSACPANVSKWYWYNCTDNQCTIPAPPPGALSCSAPYGELWSTTASTGNGCQLGQYCVKLGARYEGSGTDIIYPISQSWDFGDGTPGTNDSTYDTFHSYPYDGVKRTITLTASELKRTPARTAICRKDIYVPSAAGGTTSGGTVGGTSPTPAPIIYTAPDPYNGMLRFWNADGITPYNGSATLNVLTDTRNPDIPDWTNLKRNGGAYCGEDRADAGYQIKADGTTGGCPAENLDSCCTGGTLQCNDAGDGSRGCWDSNRNLIECGYFSDALYDSCAFRCRANQSGGGWVCRTNTSNDQCMRNSDQTWPGGTYNHNRFPRCFAPGGSGGPQVITAENNVIRWTYGTDDAPRSVERTLSIGAPTGVLFEVREICADNGCSDWNTDVLNPTANPNRGTVVKNYSGGVLNDKYYSHGLLNYFASVYQKPYGSVTAYVYDVYVKVPPPPTYTISGTVRIDIDHNDSCDTTELGYKNATVLLSRALSGTVNTDNLGRYSFTGLPAATYNLGLTNIPSNRKIISSSSITDITLGPNKTGADFCISGFLPWIQVVGDMHSQTSINLMPPPGRQ